jgi:EAL domain-containing protein (putative c-di-GMP-specific phosphodiesterase class I)
MTQTKLEDIIDRGLIDSYFQPIFSVPRQKIVGYEALLRVKDDNGEFISPIEVFDAAKKYSLILELDRAARYKSLEKFASFDKPKDTLLFLNFESSVIDLGVVGSGKILDVTSKFGINPKNIVIEIKEDAVLSERDLKSFCEFYKNKGFNIALDDVGAGASNLGRFALVKPNIIKLDISLIKDCDKNYYAQEVIKAMTDLSHKIGAVTLAEGVETIEETTASMAQNIDLFQGYYFARPGAGLADINDYSSKLHQIAEIKICEEKKSSILTNEIFSFLSIKADNLIRHLSNVEDKFSTILDVTLEEDDKLEALYILDQNGIQIGDTHLKTKVQNFLFTPSVDGEDNSFNDYYYMTRLSDNGVYLSQKYISKASGNLCKTFAKKFFVDQNEYILCIDTVI